MQALSAPDEATRVGAIPARICDVAKDLVDVDGVGLVLMSAQGSRAVLASSGEMAAVVEDLQLVTGEGPGPDAMRTGVPVLVPDLPADGLGRWPGFTRAAVAAGVGAFFSLPLQMGQVRVGVLDLVRRRPGMLAPDELADALATADVGIHVVLLMQSDAAGGDAARSLALSGRESVRVHQATGMVSAQLGVPVTDASARLRAYAITRERPLDEVAREVLDRRLRFDT